MSTPLGFRYLYDVGFIERELDSWLHVRLVCALMTCLHIVRQERNENYVTEIEVYLSRELNYNPMEDEVDDSLSVFGRMFQFQCAYLTMQELRRNCAKAFLRRNCKN